MNTRIQRRALIAVALATMAVGCKPDAPSAHIPPPSPPQVAKTEEPDTKLRIPTIENTVPPAETPDAPPAPTPPAPPTPPATPDTPPVPAATPETPATKKPAAAALAKELAPRISPEGPATVIMSDGHRQLSLVKVGDAFPTLTFVDAEGQKVALPSLYGERLTIIVFWNNSRILARDQFDRMAREIGARYGIAGVNVVAINVGDSPEVVQRILAESPKNFPCLLDPTQESFKKIATGKLPRTYVLDKNGKLQWFDIEYSRSMLRDLDNAVHLLLRGST